MKAQLVVVQGKPEGKVIPLVGPSFKIGRGESCHLRPNSDRVSREHAEFIQKPDGLSVRDLGSRNGTLVNGKAVPLGSICKLNDRDLVQVGPLTFAVAILSEAKVAAATPVAPQSPAKAKVSPDDVSTDDIDSWLVGAGGGSTADLPTNLYKGETQTITAFNGKPKVDPAVAPIPTPAPVQPSMVKEQAIVEEDEEELEEEQETADEPKDEFYDRLDSDEDDESDEESPSEVEELIDESNPFYAAKKAQSQQSANSAKKESSQDTSDVAHDILRRLMQQRKAAKS